MSVKIDIGEPKARAKNMGGKQLKPYILKLTNNLVPSYG